MTIPIQPPPSPQIQARIKSIRNILIEFKISLHIRETLILLKKNESNYCTFCSPHNVIGVCGPACALLRPDYVPFPTSDAWTKIVYADTETFHQIVEDMDAFAHAAKEARIQGWEVTAEKLRQSAMSMNDRKAEDWGKYVVPVDKSGLLRPGWGFGGPQGGASEWEEVAPEADRSNPHLMDIDQSM